MQTVFNILYDLENVEKDYIAHINRKKLAA